MAAAAAAAAMPPPPPRPVGPTDDLCNAVYKFAGEHSKHPEVEFEFRLGRWITVDEKHRWTPPGLKSLAVIDPTVAKATFVPGVSKAYFDLLAKNLKADASVEKVVETQTADEFLLDNVRKTTDNATGNVTFLTKKRLGVLDFTNPIHAWDFRASISTETKIDAPPTVSLKSLTNPPRTRYKTRTSYMFTNWRVDLTVVITTTGATREETYEVELELKHVKWLFGMSDKLKAALAGDCLARIRRLAGLESPDKTPWHCTV